MAKKKKIAQDELQELDRSYESLTGKPAKVPSRRGKIIGHCIILAVVLLAGATLGIACFGSLLDRWLPMSDVTIAGICLEGMTKQEAKAALNLFASDTYATEPMVVQVAETTVELSPAETGIFPDMDRAVNAAFRTLSTGDFDLTPYLDLNTDVVMQAVEALGLKYNTTLSQTVWEVTGEAPSLEPGAEEDPATGMTLTVTIGKPEYGLDTQELYAQILQTYSAGRFSLEGSYSMLEPERPDMNALYEEYGIAPVDAVMDPKTFEISQETYGYCFDLESASAAVEDAQYGETLTFSFQKIIPAVTREALAATLYCDVLGTCRTPYSGYDNNNRNTNLRLACEAINGKILLPGEEFTYNYTLGERTAERGYKPAATYVNGKTVDTYGGGICQVSTTLYYCTLLADLTIVERWPHGYVPAYIQWGMDASVSWNSGDFRFVNNTNYPIRIEAYRADGYVNVRILGTDEKDYYVKMDSVTLSSTPFETVYEEYAPDNKEGYTDGHVLVTPYTGYKVVSYKCKYSKDTDKLISRTEESVNNYSKRDEVIVKIVDPNAPTSEPTAEPTQ